MAQFTKGDSYTVAFQVTSEFELLDLRATIGGTLYGSIRTNDLPKEGDLYVLRLTSEQTQRIGSGDVWVTPVIETAELGVKKLAPVSVLVGRSEDLYAADIKDEIYDLVIPITVTSETATVGTILYDMLRGEKGDKGDTGNVNFDDMTPEQRAQITPEIGINGNWWINGVDTGMSSVGEQGEIGEQGIQGDNFTYSDFTPEQLQSLKVKGDKGDAGVGIASVTLTSTVGKVKTYTITFTDNSTTTFQVSDGIDGNDGYTPIKGVDYNDGEDGVGFEYSDFTTEQLEALKVKGDAFAFSDFTPEQLEALKVKGDAFEYSDFTPEQLEALKVKGDTGDKGDKGDAFVYTDFTPEQLAGLKGDKGDTGLQGIQGIQGLKGDTGAKGDTGSQGLQGIQGLKGDKGDTGEQGTQGIQGIQGVKGDTGSTGKSAYQSYLDTTTDNPKLTETEWANLINKDLLNIIYAGL